MKLSSAKRSLVSLEVRVEALRQAAVVAENNSKGARSRNFCALEGMLNDAANMLMEAQEIISQMQRKRSSPEENA